MPIFAPKSSMLNSTTSFKNCPNELNGSNLADFWQWAFSDLLQNTTRGVLAEYIVAVLLGAADTPRNPWMPFDLRLKDGRTIEIKTMSRLQAWAQKQLSEPRVVLSPKRYWNPETGIMETTPSLNADLYIICYFISEDHSIANVLDLEQWQFFVLDRDKVREILGKAKSFSLKTLQKRGITPLKAHEISSVIL